MQVCIIFVFTVIGIINKHKPVHPEIQSKIGPAFQYLHFTMMILWKSSNVLSVYSFIHNSNTAAVVAAVIQITVLILVSIFLFRWYRSIAMKQNSSFVHFNKLDVQEYVAISYVIPVLLQGFVFFFWNIFTNDLTWKTHSETTLIVHWATNFFLFLAIISKISMSYLLYTELIHGHD